MLALALAILNENYRFNAKSRNLLNGEKNGSQDT